MKLGILGGSFNPVHLGHLFLAELAISKLKLDRVVFIPAFRSPFKLDAEGMGDEPDYSQAHCKDRIDMLAASTAGDLRFAIDTCEIKREGISYTVNTLEDIIERYLPDGKPVLIIGDDLAADFLKWRESGKILQLADIAIARRIDSEAVEYPFPHIQLENEVMNVSSQIIRQKIIERGDWRSLVPSGARAIIEDRRLYGLDPYENYPDEDCTMATIQLIEAAVRKALNTDRFIHSKNTALLASDMCRRFGLDPASGYLAGIAHDFAKQLDNKQILKIIKSDKQEISAIEKDKPNLLHGKAGAILLKERFCIHNKDVLEAVAYHTSGSANMGALAKIIYIADKAESSRNVEPALRKMCSAASKEEELDCILYAVLEKTILKLKAKELVLFKDTQMLIDKMKERKS